MSESTSASTFGAPAIRFIPIYPPWAHDLLSSRGHHPIGDSLMTWWLSENQLGSQWCYHFIPSSWWVSSSFLPSSKKSFWVNQSLSKTYQIEYPLYIPFIFPRSSSYFCVTIHSPYSLFKKEQGHRNPDHSSVFRSNEQVTSSSIIPIKFINNPHHIQKNNGDCYGLFIMFIGIEIQHIQLVNKKNYEIRWQDDVFNFIQSKGDGRYCLALFVAAIRQHSTWRPRALRAPKLAQSDIRMVAPYTYVYL